MYDEAEEDRTEHVAMLKARGKGAPKKAKSAAGELRTCVAGWLGFIDLGMDRLTLTVLQIARRARRGGRFRMGGCATLYPYVEVCMKYRGGMESLWIEGKIPVYKTSKLISTTITYRRRELHSRHAPDQRENNIFFAKHTQAVSFPPYSTRSCASGREADSAHLHRTWRGEGVGSNAGRAAACH